MKINKLTASFGKLENESLSFHSGLNVIYAPNESGKSTWCAFIRAMLYGVDSSQRARAGYLPEKLRYAPWSGAPMEGEMELSADGCSITISRRSRTKGAPMRDFSAVYTGTNTPVERLNGLNAGEALTGVSRDVFTRSAFIGQGTVAVEGSPELEKRICSIVASGEEQTSYTEADDRLRAWQRKRRSNRSGMLPRLEEDMDEVRRKLDFVAGSAHTLEELEKELDKSADRRRELESEMAQCRKRQRREALDRLNRGRDQLRFAADAQDAVAESVASCREALRQSRYGMRDMDEVEQEIFADLDALDALRSSAGRKPKLLPVLISVILMLLAALLYFAGGSLVLAGAAGLLCGVSVWLSLRYRRLGRLLRENHERQADILTRYDAAAAGDIHQVLDTQHSLWEELYAAEREAKQARAAYENARAMQEGLEEAALTQLDFSLDGTSEAARLGREAAHEAERADALRQQIAQLKGRLSTVEDGVLLQTSLRRMEDEQTLLQKEYDALGIAIATLREADNELQSRFSPRLGQLAAEYMSRVTGGRYADVLIGRDFSARTRTQDDAVARESEYLSAGTLDLMYLAVRLAVCELALPEGEVCPLIIDDALVNLDEERFGQAMELLKSIAEKRQVILFTCRK